VADIIPRVRGPEVAVQAGPSVRATAQLDRSGDQALAGALGQVADLAGRIAQQEQDKNDTTAVMAARRRLSEWEGATFDPSNPDGIQKFRGKNALAIDDELLPQLDTVVGEIESGLTPRQRRQFAQVSMQFRESVQGRFNSHADREYTAFRETEQKAAIENLGRDAVTAGLDGDLERQEVLLAELVGMNRARREAEGMGDQLIASEERGLVSAVSRQTIEGMATSDPFAAHALYEQRRDQLVPEDRQAIESALYPVVEDAADDQAVDLILAGGVYQVDDPASVDQQIIALESAGRADAENPNSSATGTGQFIKGTWLELVQRHRPDLAEGRTEEQVLELRKDPALAAEMVRRYREDNALHLQRNGISPTATNLYAAHHFGPGGAVRFARSNDATPMTAILSPREIRANPYLQGKTVGDVKADWQRRGLAASEGGAAGGPPTSEAEALDRIRTSVRDPRRRNRMMAKVRERFGIQAMREQEQRKARDEQTNLLLSSADPTRPLREIIGAQAYAEYQREGKLDTLEGIRQRRIRDGFIQDDPTFVEEVSREAVTDPAAFMRRNFDDPDVQARLSTSTLAQFKKMAADGKKPETRADWANAEQRLGRGLTMLGIDSGGDATGSGSQKKNAERKQARGEFRIAYADARREWMQANPGKRPPPEVEDALLQSTVRLFGERQKEGRTAMYSSALRFQSDISQSDRNAVRNAYIERHGIAPTDAWITAWFARRALRDQTNE
jgi:hypothetical protein